jgi:hypothetical protein
VVKRRRGYAWSISPENWRSEYYAGETHTNSVLEQKGVVIDEAKSDERHKKAKAAAAASHTTFDIGDEGDMFEYDETNQKLGEGMAASRRCTIAFFFEHTYGAPPEEMCRALDSHGFADLKAAIMAYSSYTSVLLIGDARHFNLGTPNEVFRSIERAFAVAPTSKRVVEDILALPMVLDRIIEHKGTVVEDEALRHGRRLAKHKTWESLKPNKAPLKNKPRSFQRIETLVSGVPSHPDVEEARKILKSGVF